MYNYQKVVIVNFKKLNDFKSFNVRYTEFNINLKKNIQFAWKYNQRCLEFSSCRDSSYSPSIV